MSYIPSRNVKFVYLCILHYRVPLHHSTFDSKHSSPIGSEYNQGRSTRRAGGGTTASRPGATCKGLCGVAKIWTRNLRGRSCIFPLVKAR